MDIKKATLVYLMRFGDVVGEDKTKEVLLAKKTKKVGVNKWNGFGGGVKKGENVMTAAVRELFEESALKAKEPDLQFVGVLDFMNQKESGDFFQVRVYTFLLYKWKGWLCVNKEEMVDPRWFSLGHLPPDEEFMPADPIFLPHLLAGRKVTVRACYTPNQASLIGEVKMDFPDNLSVYTTHGFYG